MADDTLTTALTVAVLVAMGLRLASGARYAVGRTGRSRSMEIVRRIGWRDVAAVPVLFVAITVVATALVAVPGLDWGWWSAIGGEGNPVFGSSETTRGTAWETWLPLLFMAAFAPALPLFAYAEERIFRRGAETWTRGRRAMMTLAFGMVHALMGIPIGVALALSVGGAYFMWVYLRRWRSTASRDQATLQSAAAHTAYNAAIVALVVAVLVADMLA